MTIASASRIAFLTTFVPVCIAATFRENLEEWKSEAEKGCIHDEFFLSVNRSDCWELKNLKVDERRYNLWIKNFKASNPLHQDLCLSILNETVESPSQGGHDMIIFFNLFWRWAARGVTGFYVDSGASHAVQYSNTFFFDVCLGWKGICVEPQESWHPELLAKRSCGLVPMCLSDSFRRGSMAMDGHNAYLRPDSVGEYQCGPLDEMLEQAGRGEAGVDLWSLDVEGHEDRALDGMGDLARIGVLVIEDEWNTDVRNLYRRLTEAGMVQLLTMWGDSVWVGPSLRRLLPPGRPWLPPRWTDSWHDNREWRKKSEIQDLRAVHHDNARDPAWTLAQQSE